MEPPRQIYKDLRKVSWGGLVHLGGVLDRLGGVFGRLGDLFGPSWGVLGASWERSGACLGPLGLFKPYGQRFETSRLVPAKCSGRDFMPPRLFKPNGSRLPGHSS